MNAKQFGEWIKQLREPHISRAAMAEKYQRHPNTLKAYENNGRLPDVDYLFALSRETAFDFQKLIKLRLTAGQSAQRFTEAFDVFDQAEQLVPENLRSPRNEHHQIWFALGDTMEPTIKEGAKVIYDTSDNKPRDGQLFMFNLHSEKCIRRVQMSSSQQITLLCDNQQYPAQCIDIDDSSDSTVLGKIWAVTNYY